MKENNELNHNIEEYISPSLFDEFTGYDHLYDMCKGVKNISYSFRGFLNPITPRINYIISSLSVHGIPFEITPFHFLNKDGVKSDENKLANVIVTFKGTDETLPTIIFSAHHDIMNSESENCQDNTSSVCNLIHLCKLLKEEGNIRQSVVIAFTDCEEFGGRGMNYLISEIEKGKYGIIQAIFCLELTANGDHIWASGINGDSPLGNIIEDGFGKGIHYIRTPYNESLNAIKKGLPSCCIGSLSESEIRNVIAKGFPESWRLCHSLNDTFERSANKDDMNNFVRGMLNMIIK